MSWRDRLLPASFRGVPFHVENSDVLTGRRLARHDFPARKYPIFEDINALALEYQVLAYVVGQSYMDQRDALLRAVEAPGAGLLVHPYLGSKQVVCVAATLRENTSEGAIARLALTFVEVDLAPVPAPTENREASVTAAAAALTDTSTEELGSAVTAPRAPEFVREATANQTRLIGSILAGLDIFTRREQEVAAYARRVTNLIDSAAALAVAPANLALAVRVAVGSVLDAAENGFEALYAYQALFGLQPAWVTGGLSELQRAADRNALALVLATRQLAVAGAARAAMTVSWESYDQAVAARSALVDEIEALTADSGDDLYDALAGLRARLVRALPPEDQDLPRLGTFTPVTTLPSLVVAYELYDDARRGDEIATRNGVPYPGFLLAGVPLQVLVDA